MKIELDYKILQAALIIAPKQDIRYYLNGVSVEQGKVIVTDGHRLLVIPYEYNGDEFKPFIISGEALRRLHSQLSAKERRTGLVTIDVAYSEASTDVSMTCYNAIANNCSIDGNFPEWRRVVPKDKTNHREDLTPYGIFDWDYMADFKKVAKILNPRESNPKLDLVADGHNTAMVKFLTCESDVIGCIMPIRVK